MKLERRSVDGSKTSQGTTALSVLFFLHFRMKTETMYKTISESFGDVTKELLTLAAEIQAYESDTFSAEGADITSAEAAAVSVQIMKDALNTAIEHLDGVTITNILEELRERD